MPDPDKLLKTLYKATEAVRQTPGRRGRFVQLPPATDIVVAGDLHGHVGNFQAIYKFADLGNRPGRHLILQEVVHGKFYYPNGGDKSHQLIDLFAALKCQYPDRVHFLLGNHELAQWTNRMVMKGDKNQNALFIEGINQAYGMEKGPNIYNAYLRLFGVLPLAIRTANRVFVSHSLPREKVRDQFDLRLLETDMFPTTDLAPGGQVFELIWGRDTRPENSSKFLALVDADYLITGHVPCEEGIAFPSTRHAIVDCCDTPAAFMVVPADRPFTEEELRAGARMI